MDVGIHLCQTTFCLHVSGFVGAGVYATVRFTLCESDFYVELNLFVVDNQTCIHCV